MLDLFDTILISLYRLTGNPLWDYFIGTFLLALLSILAGQGTVSLVFRFNRKHIEKLDDRFETLNRLTVSAMESGDKQNYRVINKEANDTYGLLFFNRFGLSAATLWPAFLALAWMQERFAEIAIPIPPLGLEANYFLVFFGAYVAARIFFTRGRKYLSSLLRCRAAVA